MPDDEQPTRPPPATPRNGCCWPLWHDDDRPDGRFCDAPRVPGRPYCATHCRRAYAAPNRRPATEEAA